MFFPASISKQAVILYFPLCDVVIIEQSTHHWWKVHHITLFIVCFDAESNSVLGFTLSFWFVLLGQEINAELGSMSESTDDEFWTTRIVRRRVFIKVLDMANGVLAEHEECSIESLTLTRVDLLQTFVLNI